jgi:hypothetical protein
VRTRVQGAISKSYVRCTDFAPSGAVDATSVEFNLSGAEGACNTISDESTPGFNRLKSKGVIVMNPLHLVKDSRQTSHATWVCGPHPSWGTRVLEGTLAVHWQVPVPIPTWFATRVNDAKASTLTKAYAKVEEECLQGLVALAEARKTVQMLASPFARSRELITLVSERSKKILGQMRSNTRRPGAGAGVKNADDSRKAFEAAWLETRFGWRPVLADLAGAFEAYAERNWAQDVMPVRKVVRASEIVEWDSGSFLYEVVPPPKYLSTCKMVGQSTKRTKISSGVLYEVSNESTHDAARQLLGLRLADVPAAAYELVPYGFVVDRFIKVGTWLKAITPKPNVSVKGAWTTTVEVHTDTHKVHQVSAVINIAPVTTFYGTGLGTFSAKRDTIIRTPNPSLPPIPPVNLAELNWQQHLDHLTLITSGLKGLRSLRI